jgi:adenosylcobinamide kinase/adenosylcobinamide-phosphate guanylyltransferase
VQDLSGQTRPLTTLVLGGARSGKSRLAEGLCESQSGPCVYLATGQAHDPEMAERIAAHQARRGGRWETLEAPLDLVPALRTAASPGRAVLVDCLTLWLSNLLHAERDAQAEGAALAQALPRLQGPVVLVSNEVGLGIVPDNALARRFRDLAGRLHQEVAAACEQVVFTAAGLPLTLKSPSQNSVLEA